MICVIFNGMTRATPTFLSRSSRAPRRAQIWNITLKETRQLIVWKLTLEFRIIRSVFELYVAFWESSGLAAGSNTHQDEEFRRKRSIERMKNNDSYRNPFELVALWSIFKHRRSKLWEVGNLLVLISDLSKDGGKQRAARKLDVLACFLAFFCV